MDKFVKHDSAASALRCSIDQRFNFDCIAVTLDNQADIIDITASAFRKLPSIYVFSYFPFGFEGRMWDLIVSVPDHCLSFYFEAFNSTSRNLDDLLNIDNVHFEQMAD